MNYISWDIRSSEMPISNIIKSRGDVNSTVYWAVDKFGAENKIEKRRGSCRKTQKQTKSFCVGGKKW